MMPEDEPTHRSSVDRPPGPRRVDRRGSVVAAASAVAAVVVAAAVVAVALAVVGAVAGARRPSLVGVVVVSPASVVVGPRRRPVVAAAPPWSSLASSVSPSAAVVVGRARRVSAGVGRRSAAVVVGRLASARRRLRGRSVATASTLSVPWSSEVADRLRRDRRASRRRPPLVRIRPSAAKAPPTTRKVDTIATPRPRHPSSIDTHRCRLPRVAGRSTGFYPPETTGVGRFQCDRRLRGSRGRSSSRPADGRRSSSGRAVRLLARRPSGPSRPRRRSVPAPSPPRRAAARRARRPRRAR